MTAFNLTTAVIRREVEKVRFGIYTDDEVRTRSVTEITTPRAFDALNTPLPRGLYDPLLGPTDSGSSCCPTCGNAYLNCPGHAGHIELCVPVYQPLTFPKLISLLRVKCFCCHSFRLSKRNSRIIAAKFHLLDCGRFQQMLGLEDCISNAIHRARTQNTPADTANNANHAASSIDQLLDNIFSLPVPSKLTATSHERAVKRELVKEFISSNMSSKKCQNCQAYSPKIRQDSSNKVFLTSLSDKNKRLNALEKCILKSATSTTIDGDTGWDSEDTDIEEEQEENGYDSRMEEDENSNDEPKEKENVVTPQADQVAATKKADKFMHALEVEAQARLTWTMEPYLCSHIFGCAQNSQDIFFMRVLSVPPSRFRPPVIMGTMTVEHAQNHYLNKILELNAHVCTLMAESSKDSEEGNQALQARAISAWIDLQTTVNCYIDSSKDPGAGGTAPNGIRQLLEKKEGIFRKHMMGKRVNYACRSVISPDPYIGTNEIGIPLYFAKVLTYPTPVTPLNVAEMRSLVKCGVEEYPGACWVELPNGRRLDLGKMNASKREAVAARLLTHNGGIVKVGRQLRNGDMVLMNRQPSLHKPSIMAHSVRVLHNPTQKTIRMHYANCNTYNADYDGDEMNCHFPQNDLARAESEIIAKTDLQYIVPTDGSPLRGLIQDHVDGGVKMCSKDTFFEKWEYQQLLFAALTSLEGLELIRSDTDIAILPPAIQKPRELWTGKQVLTTLLQHLRQGRDGDPFSLEILPGISLDLKAKTPNFAFGEDMEEHRVVIRDGELLRGVLDKAAFGAADFSLVHAVYEAYGPSKAGLLLNALGRLFTAYLQYYSGHSCRMEDLILTSDADRERQDLVQMSYNIGSRAAKAWADSDGGKMEICPMEDQPAADQPLMPVEIASTAAKIAQLLSGKEGANNAAALDGYMQSQINPLASTIIKKCLPNGLAVSFPENTFGLMVMTGAKGSTVNQSQVSCLLGQQALEGRRVPRMSSGRTLPSFSPYDPNPRADGFIADRFLTGVRPQEYYFHCMAGREGLVDTAVKTSRSGYLQRCLVKHLEELMVCYDYTVRNGEGGVVQFLYGEDGIDPTKAAYLDCTSTTFQYMARNEHALTQRHVPLPNSAIDVAAADRLRAETVASGSSGLLKKGSFVKARKLRFGSEWKRGALCRGWFSAHILKAHRDGLHFDLTYVDDKSQARRVPLEVDFSYAGSSKTRAESSRCRTIEPAVQDPILSEGTGERRNHRIGSSGFCVSERVAGCAADALSDDLRLRSLLKSAGLQADDFGRLVAAKFSSALCAPGEAVGCIAAQSIGEPSTQMTLNTFHLAGSGANVTLGIPRLREILMTASRNLKTPTMSVPFVSSVTPREATRLTRYFTKINLQELIASHKGINVTESLQQNPGGSWERAYCVKLKLHSAERIAEAFELTLEDVAAAVAYQFFPNLSRIMKMELKRSHTDVALVNVQGGESTDFVYDDKAAKSKKKARDDDEYDDEIAGDEDGVTGSRFGHKKEIASYGEMDEEEKRLAKEDRADDQTPVYDDEGPAMITDDEGGHDEDAGALGSVNTVRIDKKNDVLILQPLRVDPAARPLLMVGLVERAASSTIVRSRPSIEEAFVNDEDDRGRCLQTAGVNFEELWKLNEVQHEKLASNDIWAIRCAYGVEAARGCIVEQIRNVFAVYGISVDPRHLTLIADYMTYDGGFKPMNRSGMADASSSFLQMSFETTANFMVDAALNNRHEPLMSPSANIVMGRPVRHGTGAFECIVKS